jgi:hypothetical protein
LSAAGLALAGAVLFIVSWKNHLSIHMVGSTSVVCPNTSLPELELLQSKTLFESVPMPMLSTVCVVNGEICE